MKTKTTSALRILFVVIIGIMSFISCQKEGNKDSNIKQEVAYNEVIMDTICSCTPSWFPHQETPAPLEGKGSPFDVSTTTNCIFHQWSWQKFLWLTKPDDTLPLFLNQSKIIQVSDLMAKIPQQAGAHVVLTDTEQAGSDNGVLTTNPSYNKDVNKSFTVFYSIHTSLTMMTAAEDFMAQFKAGTLPENNLATFPVGSLELKVSWVEVAAIPADKIDNYFVTEAALSIDNGVTYKNTKMALLGMHVVGVVENHPEFIWATFEHSDIAPVYNWQTNSAVSTTDKLLFSKGTTTGLGGITYDKIAKAPLIPHKVYDLFQFGVPRDATGFMTTSQSEPINFDNISDINNCVATKLTDVWKNYFYGGSIWIDTDGMTPIEQAKKIVSLKGAIGKAAPGSSARGSLNNANISMETFTQTFQKEISNIAVDNLANCFSCHNGVSYKSNTSPIYLSHIFDAYIQASQGKKKEEINMMKDQQQIEQLLKVVK
ncbi:hypothetical protein [Aquimarina addita]